MRHINQFFDRLHDGYFNWLWWGKGVALSLERSELVLKHVRFKLGRLTSFTALKFV
jgi:hypothetical protein